MAPSYSTSSLLLLLFAVLRALAQAPPDPLKDFCRRYGHQTAVIDRKLYIDGGWLYANPIVRNPVPVISKAASPEPPREMLLTSPQTKDCFTMI